MTGDDTLASESVDREHDDDSTPIAPPASDLHESLAVESRRRVLRRLLDHPSTSADELADFLAGKAAAEDRDAMGSEAWERIRTRLHHVDLPQLDDIGLIAYDRDDETVQLSSLAEPARELIRSSVEYEHETDFDQP